MSTLRTPRSLLALALATSVHAAALANVADPGSPESLQSVRAQADRLVTDGQYVRAHAILLEALSNGQGDASERGATLVALEGVRRKLADADREEIALQQAELAMDRGNLALAARRAEGVLESAKEESAMWTRADALRADITRRQEALRPAVLDALDQAGRDVKAERYAQAKGQLSFVRRSGLELQGREATGLTRMEQRIADAERRLGRIFDLEPLAAGAVQAGVVRTREDGGQDQPQAGQDQPLGDPAELFVQARQQDARLNLSQADAAFERGELREARRLYVLVRGNADVLTPEERQLVSDRIDEINIRLGDGDLGQATEPLGQQNILRRQNAEAQFGVGVREVNRLLDQGDLSGARNELSQTRLRFQGDRDVFSQPEVDARLNQLADLEGRIERRAQQLLDDRDREIRAQAQEDAERNRSEQRNQRQRQITQLLEQAREFQKDMRYREALDRVEQVLVIDPINSAGLLLKELYEHIILYQEYNSIRDERNKNLAQLSVDNERALITPPNIVNYPENWPVISQQREARADFVDTPANRRVLAQLENTPVQVTLQDNPLEDALTYIATQAQVDLDVNWDALDELGIGRSDPVTIKLSGGVDASRALSRVLDKASIDEFSQADWAIVDGLLTVSSADRLLDETDVGIYDINDLLHIVPEYDEVPELELDQALQSGQGGGGGQSPFQNNNDQDLEQVPLQDRIDEIIEIIEGNIEDDRGFVEGRWTIGNYRGLLIIKATPKAHRQIGGLLNKLRAQQALQINVETRFLLVDQDYFEQIGFDLDIYFNADNQQVRDAQLGGPLGPGDPTIQAADFFDFGGAPLGRPRVVSGGGVIDANGDGFNEATAAQGVTAPTSGFSPIGFGQDSFGLAALLAPSEGLASDILSASPALGIAGQFLDDVQVDFLVQATQADRRSTQLTAPRLTFTNGQIANIFVATQIAYVGDLQPIVSDSAVGFDPTVQVATEGVTLLVQGTISSDRRYVTMNVDAGLATIDGFDTQAVTAVAGGALVSSDDVASFIELPLVTVTRVRTTVTVPDEGTILLGGQRLVNEFEVETGVPLLSKLPVLNRFFTNRIESKEEQTLLILMKPTVLIQSEEENQSFPGLQDALTSSPLLGG